MTPWLILLLCAATATGAVSVPDPSSALSGGASLDPQSCSLRAGAIDNTQRHNGNNDGENNNDKNDNDNNSGNGDGGKGEDCMSGGPWVLDSSSPFSKASSFVAGNVTSACAIDLELLLRGKFGPHSAAMIDSTGKSYNDAGKWDECSEIGDKTVHGGAHYCLLRLSEATFGQDGYIGLCVPKSCTGAELTVAGGEAITMVLQRLGIKDSVAFDVDCTEAETQMDAKAVVCLVITFMLIALCVLATVVDLIEQRLARVAKRRSDEGLLAINESPSDGYRHLPNHDAGERVESGSSSNNNNNSSSSSSNNNGSNAGANAKNLPGWYKVLRCFRVNHNLSRLVAPNPVDNLTALNGLRVISILGIILGHTHLYMLNVGLTNPGYVIYRVLGRWSVAFISGCELFVDVFFFLSGFLVAYGALKELTKKGRIPWAFFYLHRYLRLTPAYAYVLFVYVALSRYAGEGPNWPRYQRTLGFPNLTTENCSKYWWGNMLYINNFYPHEFEQQCFKHSWFLANDFQFYVVSPIYLIAYHRSRKMGWALLSVSMFVFMMIRFALVEGYDITLDQGNTRNYINALYGKPYGRFPAYLVGFATAFAYNECGRKYRLKPVWLVLGSVLAGTSLIAAFYGKKVFFEHPPSFHWDKTRNDLFIVFSRVTAALGAAWFMFISFLGDGGLVRALLGAHFWTPLARLTYSTYLVHPTVISVVYYTLRNYVTYSTLSSVYFMIGHSVISFGAALIIFCLVEKPGLSLEMLLFSRGKKK